MHTFVVRGRRARALTKVDAMDRHEETVEKYAQSQGLNRNHERVRKYAGDNDDVEIEDPIEEEDENDVESPVPGARTDGHYFMSDQVRKAVEKYAESQGLDIDHPRVQKYARGLTGQRGDFGDREQDLRVGSRKVH